MLHDDLPHWRDGMRLLVCGGRDYDESALIFDVLTQLHNRFPLSAVIQGGAKGADQAAAHWAMLHGIHTLTYPALWRKEGRQAGFLRNARMLTEGHPDAVVAFPGGNGTADMVRKAKTFGLPVWKPMSPKSKPPFDGYRVATYNLVD